MREAIAGHRPSLVELPAEHRGIEEAAGEKLTPIVVVLGAHRSGTSLCAHVLSVLGVDIADVVNAHAFNAKGEWERWELNRLHDRVLDLFDRGYSSPHHDLPLPSGWWADPRVQAIKRAITAFLRRRMTEGALFGFKDPRTARLLPLWQQVFKELKLAPKIVLCLRNPAQAARSLAARDALDRQIGEYRWFTYMIECLGNLQNHQLCTIDYEDWFLAPQINLDKLTRALDIGWDLLPADLRIAVNNIVDAGLRHDEAGSAEPQQPLVRSLYTMARSFTDDPSSREEVARLAEQFASFRELHLPHFRDLERLATAAAELEGRLAEATQRQEEMAARLREREAEFAGSRRAVEAAETALAAATEAAQTAQAQLQRVQGDLDRAERAARECQDKSDAAEAEIGALQMQLARAESAAAPAAEERDRMAARCSHWFEAAMLPLSPAIRRRRPSGWRFGRFLLRMTPWRGRGSPMSLADKARDKGEWALAARYYGEALGQMPDRQAVWVQLGHSLKEAGRPAEAELAYRRAIELDGDHLDALVALAQLLRQQERDGEAAALYSRTLQLARDDDLRRLLSTELRDLQTRSANPQPEPGG